MKIKSKEYNIKLPSGDVVTIKNLLEVSKIIARTGKNFTEKHILENNSPVNEKSLFRILSYLKYLGLIYDTREIETKEGKERKIQKWNQRDTSKAVDFFYALKAGREQVAHDKFSELVKLNDLFLGIKEELINKNPSPTQLDLENYFRKKNPGKNPRYYQRGVSFALSLLSSCDLIIKEGNAFKLSESEKENLEKEDSPPPKNEKEPSKIDLENNKYIVNINGKDANFQISVNELTDVDDVEAILNIIRKKLT